MRLYLIKKRERERESIHNTEVEIDKATIHRIVYEFARAAITKQNQSVSPLPTPPISLAPAVAM